MSRVRRFLADGAAQRWLTLAATLAALAMIAGLVLVVVRISAAFFWPKPLVELTLEGGEVTLGEVWEREADPNAPGSTRIRLKVGNRDITGADFRWLQESRVRAARTPADAWLLERREYGNLYGTPLSLATPTATVAATDPHFRGLLAEAVERAGELVDDEASLLIAADRLHAPTAEVQRRLLAAERRNTDTAALAAELERAIAAENERVTPVLDRLVAVREQLTSASLTVRVATPEGPREKTLSLAGIVRAAPVNVMSLGAELALYLDRWAEFVLDRPREANTEGGIFPAIFGTALMVLLMTVAVVPLGVVTALYLNEYARDNALTRTVRLALANLAGVPSIVFGAFGLAFFVYIVGGGIDRFFFSDLLPTPTFGTGGILWASLTLALLTLPVVVVATEEGLQSVPQAVRDGARALGATRWQTIRRVVLPYATPGILTGTILAIARGAGEVAPLMVTGVVKLAPALAVDGSWPFLHLERKFMHLGFHIYDVGFQSPNVEAAKPMVYATVLVLLLLVVVLNLAAIALRNRQRRKLRGSAV
jgi:phosphate transport system permease protein